MTETFNNTELCPDVSNGGQSFKIWLLSFMALFIIISNIFIVLLILTKDGKISRMHFFLLHLCIADLLTALFTLLPEVIWTLTLPEFHGGNLACKSVKFLQLLGPYLSSYTLCAVAWDRKKVSQQIKTMWALVIAEDLYLFFLLLVKELIMLLT